MGPITLNTSDPLTLIALVVIGGIVVWGIAAFLREIGSEAILLADAKKQRRKTKEQLDRMKRGERP